MNYEMIPLELPPWAWAIAALLWGAQMMATLWLLCDHFTKKES